MKTIAFLAVATVLTVGAFCGSTSADAAERVYDFAKGTIVDAGATPTETVSLDGAFGGKAVDLKSADNSVSVEIDAERAGFYELTIRYSQPYDKNGKSQIVLVNGRSVGKIFCAYTEKGAFDTVAVTAKLNEGVNTATVQASWGWTLLDSLAVAPATNPTLDVSVDGKLSNPNASEKAQSLYRFLCDVYGKRVIAGQQESTWISENYEFDLIQKASGKLPALRGLDYMNDDFAGCNRRAKAWSERGGIVTICWHCGSDFRGSHRQSLDSNLDWDKALTEGTPEYDALIAGMDKGAKALLELKEADLPVLWRPFHEFDGKWFWWGKGGAENFKKLWRLMYDRYTNYWKLDNLIWVLGYCGDVNDGWYPGDEYVDVVGADTYVDDDGSLAGVWLKTATVARKPICLHENGPIPSPDKLREDEVGWLWFMTWHTTFVSRNPINTTEHLNEVYNSDYVLTLDELPDVGHYRSGDLEKSQVDANE